MLKQLLRDSIAYSVGRALSALVGVFLLPLYTAHLAPSEYGLYDMGNAAISLASLVIALEIAQGAARYYCESTDPVLRREYFSTALWFTLLAFAALWLLALVVAPYLAQPLLGPDARTETLVLVATAAATIAAFRIGQAQLRWMLRARAFLACSLIQVGVTTAVAATLVVNFDQGAHGLIWGLIAGNAVGFMVALWFGRSGIGLSWSSARLREMLAFSAPLVTSSAAVWVALYVDRIAIKEFMTMDDVGRYGVAYRFAATVDILMFGFDKAFVPLLYSNYRDPNTPAALAKLLRFLLIGGGSILLALAALSHEVLHTLAAPSYQDAAPLVPVLAAGILLTRLASIGPGLWIASRTGLVAWINIAVAIANLVLNLLLIPVLGVMGAALATACSGLLGFIINMNASQRHYAAPHAWPRIILSAAIVAGGIAVLLVLGANFPPLSIAGTGLKLLTALLVLVLAAVTLFRRGDWHDLASLLRRLRKPPITA